MTSVQLMCERMMNVEIQPVKQQEAQLSQTDCAMLRVTDYFATLKVIRNDIIENSVSPY